MDSRDRADAAPLSEPDGAADGWATEESVADNTTPPPPEPETPATALPKPRLDGAIGDTPQLPGTSPPSGPGALSPSGPAAASDALAEPRRATPSESRPGSGSAVPSTPPAGTPPSSASGSSWLASAEGLVPVERSLDDAGFDADATIDIGATQLHQRAIPSVAPRTAAPTGWLPFDPETPAQADDDDPYGRRGLVAATPYHAPTAPRPAAVEPWFDPRDANPASGRWPAEARVRRGFPWRRLVLSFVLGLILSAFVAGGAIYAYQQQYDNRILPNVHVGSVDVSGLTPDAARDRLTQAFAGYGEGTVNVNLAGATTQIPYSDFDRHADVDAMVDAAFGVGRASGVVERLLGEFRTVTRGATIQPTVVLDGDKLATRVHEIAQAAEWQPVNAGAVVTQDGFATTQSKAGQTVDEGTAAADAASQLADVSAPDSIDVTLTATSVPPAVSDTSAQLAAKQAALMQNDVVLKDGDDTWTIPAATVHQWLTFTIINNRVRIAIDTKAVLNQLKPLAKKIDRPAVNATIKLSGTKIVFDTPSQGGRTFNASKTTTAVVNALRNRAQETLRVDEPIPPVLTLVEPTLTTEEAKAALPLMKPISSWTTNYQPSDHNGFGANIKIPTRTINGYVVAPHETFSFWKAVGPVTAELGYKPGGAIIDGHTEPQGAIGGGICSCSTTLFNAALRAGFQMGDRLNHFYYIDRYPLGLDATVFISASGQAQDMSWTNDTDYPVVIEGINGAAFVKFVLYSVPNGRTTAFTDPIVKNYTKATTVTKVDKTIPRGTTKHIEYATDGQDVWVTRTVKDKAGKVLHKETYYSHYATITGIILTNP